MRFTEIANPEDQLALWKLISDKMWDAFAQPAAQGTSSQPPQSSTPKGRAASPAKSVTRPITKTSHKASAKSKAKAVKPKRAPMAPAPKPLPKPNPQQRIYPKPPASIQKPVTPIEPMTNGYDERDKDQLVMHSRAQHPFKTISQIKSALSGQKCGFQAENIVLF